MQGLCDDFDHSVNVSDINISVVYNQGADGLCNTGYVLSMALGLKNVRLEKAYYYDNYDFLSGGRKAAFGEATPTLPGFSSINANGLLTGTVLSTSDGPSMRSRPMTEKGVRWRQGALRPTVALRTANRIIPLPTTLPSRQFLSTREEALSSRQLRRMNTTVITTGSRQRISL